MLGAASFGPSSAPSTFVVEARDERLATAGIEHIVVVPIESTPAGGALWLGYGKRPAPASDELVMFDLLGDFIALALRNATITPASEPSDANGGDDFVSQAAHDLRTPLTPISMLLQTLERKAAAGTVDIDSIGRARRQVQRLTDMVSDMVDISRLRDGQLLLEPAVMDMRDAFDRGAKAFGERERRRSVELALGDEPLWIVADADRTVHALASLFEHVARLSQGDAPLRAHVERQNSHVVVHIDSERVTPLHAGLETGIEPRCVRAARHTARARRPPRRRPLRTTRRQPPDRGRARRQRSHRSEVPPCPPARQRALGGITHGESRGTWHRARLKLLRGPRRRSRKGVTRD